MAQADQMFGQGHCSLQGGKGLLLPSSSSATTFVTSSVPWGEGDSGQCGSGHCGLPAPAPGQWEKPQGVVRGADVFSKDQFLL